MGARRVKNLELPDGPAVPEVPRGKNGYAAIVTANDGGFWATTGYGTELLRLDADGKAVSSWRADQGGKANVFYGALQEMADGCVYVANWTGPDARDSFKGWQLIEFGPNGGVVWWLDSPDRFGSIVGFDVLESPAHGAN